MPITQSSRLYSSGTPAKEAEAEAVADAGRSCVPAAALCAGFVVR